METKKGQGKELFKGVMQNFPHEIVVEILAKLPVKSLLRFRCACKPWCTLIDTPQFSKMHLNQKNKHQRVAILMSSKKLCCQVGIDEEVSKSLPMESSNDWSRSLYSLDFEKAYDDDNHVEALKLDIRLNPYSFFWSSCNGLLLLMEEDTLLLVNPSTREYKRIATKTCRTNKYVESYGIGYDSSIDDYKVVNLIHYDFFGIPYKTVVYIYTLRTNTWRRIQDFPYDHYNIELGPAGIFMNGALHWLFFYSNGLSPVIGSLNLVDEQFRDVPLPGSVTLSLTYELRDIGGCLCVFDTNSPYDLWLMKEYGVTSSWTKYIIALSNSSLWVNPLFLTRDDKTLLMIASELFCDSKKKFEKLFFYNKNAKRCQYLVISNITNRFQVATYMESLVSLNCNEKQYDAPNERRMKNGNVVHTEALGAELEGMKLEN